MGPSITRSLLRSDPCNIREWTNLSLSISHTHTLSLFLSWYIVISPLFGLFICPPPIPPSFTLANAMSFPLHKHTRTIDTHTHHAHTHIHECLRMKFTKCSSLRPLCVTDTTCMKGTHSMGERMQHTHTQTDMQRVCMHCFMDVQTFPAPCINQCIVYQLSNQGCYAFHVYYTKTLSNVHIYSFFLQLYIPSRRVAPSINYEYHTLEYVGPWGQNGARGPLVTTTNSIGWVYGHFLPCTETCATGEQN